MDGLGPFGSSDRGGVNGPFCPIHLLYPPTTIIFSTVDVSVKGRCCHYRIPWLCSLFFLTFLLSSFRAFESTTPPPPFLTLSLSHTLSMCVCVRERGVSCPPLLPHDNIKCHNAVGQSIGTSL